MDILIESGGNIEVFEDVQEEPDYQIQPIEEKIIYEEFEDEKLNDEVVEEHDQEEKEQIIEDVIVPEKEIIKEVQIVKVVSDNIIKTESSISVNSIIDTPLNEYSIEQSLLLYIFLALFVAGFIVLLRGSILKWS